MAVSVNVIHTGPFLFIADVTATADADTTTGNIPHGLGADPLIVIGTALRTNYFVSQWLIGHDATNLSADKLTAVGSGFAAAQLRIIAMLPWSPNL